MHLCIITLYHYRDYFSIIPENVGIVLLVSSAVILMFYLPIQLGDFFVDLRLIPLAFIAHRWGFKHTLAALADIQVRQKLQYYAEHDHLTGLYNIRHFHEAIRQHIKSHLSKYIVMIDIDHFKAINDTYGHTSGDLILKQVAQVIVDSISRNIQQTVVGRYGGEEFNYVESIRHRIGATAFLTETGAKVSITVSIGVAEIVDRSLLNQAINEADHCLYTSKHNGRNQAHYA
ncbi:GGDEF domain-containing protein [Brevibacillus invocatus]|nr:GGDEF domain-containing protein [Brevibacillus invocatus]